VEVEVYLLGSPERPLLQGRHRPHAQLGERPGAPGPHSIGQGGCHARDGAWANMKNGLGNLAAADVDELTAIIKNRLKSIQYRPVLIDAFLAQTGLKLEPQPP
jgi:hypothetical protein